MNADQPPKNRAPERLGLTAAFSVMMLLACSPGQDSVSAQELGRSLLDQTPTAVLEMPGTLRPDSALGWGPNGGSGWALKLRALGATNAAESIGSRADLVLHSNGSVRRDLELDLASVAPFGPITIALNGQTLGEVIPTRELQTFPLTVPDTLWRAGSNQLEFSSSHETQKVLLSEVRLSSEAIFDRQRATLDSGVTVEWELFADPLAFLDVVGSAASAGRFELHIYGSIPGQAQRTLLDSIVREVEADEPIRFRTGLGGQPEELKHVNIQWQGEPGSELALSLLNVVERPRAPLPPILFLSVDTLSAQNMSIYGYDRETTPHLADLVADCVLFEQARSNAPWTVPSYLSQLSGLYASSNRMSDEEREKRGIKRGKRDYLMPTERFTLAEMMRASGYRTAAFVDNPWLGRVPGMSQGFDLYDTSAADAPIDDAEMGMRYVLPASLEYLRASSRQPAFVFAQILDVHGPYHTHAPFEGQFAQEIPASDPNWLPIANTDNAIFGSVPAYIASLRVSDPEATQVSGSELRADYDEKILELDATLGDFFESLKANGLYDDLLIVFSADHGESMDDHDFFFRHGLVYDSAIHVPLLVKLPHQEGAGSRVQDPVQLVDLYPTFAEWIRLSASPLSHGRSLVPALQGKAFESGVSFSQANLLNQTSLTQGSWKLVVSWPLEATLEAFLTFAPFQRRLFDEIPVEFVEFFGAVPPVEPRQVVRVASQLREASPNVYWQLMERIRAYEPVMELYNIKQDPEESIDLSHEQPERTQALFKELTRELDRAESKRDFDPEGRLSLIEEQDGVLEALGYVGD